ncbi:exodeoxyribonuclease VII small subunit [Candidatus Nitrosacidococcus sp. I8]
MLNLHYKDLESIVSQMEQEEIRLDKSIKLYEKK